LVRFVPETVIVVVPEPTVTLDGDTADTTGFNAVTANSSAGSEMALFPDGVVTIISDVFTNVRSDAGTVAVTVVALTTVTFVNGWPFQVTEVAPVKPEPVTVITVAGDPTTADDGLTAVTAGGAGSTLNTSNGELAALTPAVADTSRSDDTTAVKADAGIVPVTVVALTAVTFDSWTPFQVTLVAPVKLVPVRVKNAVGEPTSTLDGLTAVIVGKVPAVTENSSKG
jgi:hypothetical protein